MTQRQEPVAPVMFWVTVRYEDTSVLLNEWSFRTNKEAESKKHEQEDAIDARSRQRVVDIEILPIGQIPARSLVGLVLVTRAPVTSIDALVGRASHDDCDKAGKVQKFFEDWGLPRSRGDFRSIFVYYKGDNVDLHGSAIKAYGNPFLMNNATIIPSLEIVCSQDIQNAAVNAIDAPELAQRNYSRFEDLSEIPPSNTAARTDALIRALIRRERPYYVEGRMPRTPVREDILEKLF